MAGEGRDTKGERGPDKHGVISGNGNSVLVLPCPWDSLQWEEWLRGEGRAVTWRRTSALLTGNQRTPNQTIPDCMPPRCSNKTGGAGGQGEEPQAPALWVQSPRWPEDPHAPLCVGSLLTLILCERARHGQPSGRDTVHQAPLPYLGKMLGQKVHGAAGPWPQGFPALGGRGRPAWGSAD